MAGPKVSFIHKFHCAWPAFYTGVLIQIQSTSGREASSNPPMGVDQVESRLVGIHTQGKSGQMQIKSGLEPQRKLGLSIIRTPPLTKELTYQYLIMGSWSWGHSSVLLLYKTHTGNHNSTSHQQCAAHCRLTVNSGDIF